MEDRGMKLKEMKGKKVKFTKMNLKLQGARKANVYSLSTGCTVIYSEQDGKEHVSISNFDRMPTIEELDFVKNELMKKDVNVKIMLPRETNHINIRAYIGHIIEVKDKVMCS